MGIATDVEIVEYYHDRYIKAAKIFNKAPSRPNRRKMHKMLAELRKAIIKHMPPKKMESISTTSDISVLESF